VRVAGMRQTYRRIRTKSKHMMAVLTLEDMEGSLQIFIPPYLYRKNHLALQEFGPFIIEGVIQRDPERQSIKMTAEKIVLLTDGI
ncbi:MAG: hypothetical protein SVP52_08775, partial [Chloroflexota bacterium]|nr:hypothetical protein [Chloroflexota bacterium]